MADTTFGGTTAENFIQAINNITTTTQITLPQLAANSAPAISPNADENTAVGAPTINIYARGNAAFSQTGLQRTNAKAAHVCSIPQGVARAVNMAGAMGGQIVQGIRNAIKAILTALGLSPTSGALVSQLKKIAQYVKDITKFIKDINKFLAGFVKYIAAIKKFIQYILSLPLALLAYFGDCLKQLYGQLKAGYLSVLSDATEGTDNSESVVAAAKDLINSTTDLVKAATQTVATVTVITKSADALAKSTSAAFSAYQPLKLSRA